MGKSSSVQVRVRDFREQDREAVLALADRLAVGIAPWRSTAGMIAAARGWVTASLDGIGPEKAVFVAESAAGRIAGFGTVASHQEFSGEAQAYIGELAVAAESEGQGIGQALLTAIEHWAATEGLPLVVLETGAANTRARRFYAKSGFIEESVKLTKLLAPRP